MIHIQQLSHSILKYHSTKIIATLDNQSVNNNKFDFISKSRIQIYNIKLYISMIEQRHYESGLKTCTLAKT